MLNRHPKVAIIYLSYHLDPHWEKAKNALVDLKYPKEQLELIIVDNPHEEKGGSTKFINKNILPLTGGLLPRVVLLAQERNLGFAEGCNVGIKKALELGCDYVYLHNQDGFMDKRCLFELVVAMEADTNIGAAQSLIMLYPNKELVNTSGNAYHYLGFGYGGNYRKKIEKIKILNINDVGYASGASVMLRASTLQKESLLDEDFFMYHEDLEYSLRLRSRGYRTVAVSSSIFYHNYNFSRNKNKYYLMERNRLATLLMYYKILTITLLVPIFLLIELGLLVVSLKQGWAPAKVRAWSYWFKSGVLKKWLNKRKQIQKARTVSDRQLLKSAVGAIEFEDEKTSNPVVKYIANPIMSLYWLVVRQVIFW